ncbi:hypothetical protein Tco_1174447 [Tanacetum coccineum]
MRAPLRTRFKDLPTSDMKEILLQRMLEENYDKGRADHRVAYEALQDSIRRDECEDFDVDKAQEETKKKSKQDSPKTLLGSPPSPPPPPPPPSGASGASGTTGASDSAQAPPLPPPSSPTYQGGDDENHTDGKAFIVVEEVECHIPTTTYVPPPENSLLAQTGDITTFMDWYCKQQGISELTPKDLEGPAYEIVKVFHPDVVHLQFQMEECHKLLTDKVDDAILKYNVSKPLPLCWRPACLLKMKAAFYPDVGLEQLVPDQFWIEEECKYDIAVMYGISHWWFQRQRFYIDRFSSKGDRRAVRTHMRILSVVRIEVFSLYGYNYMKKIILCRADLKEYVIAKRDFKYLYPSDFEDLYLLNLQGHLNHLSPDDKKVQTQLNLTKPRWEATGLEFMHDYKILDSPRAILFRDKYGMQMLMRFNEIYKFSEGTLQQIDKALDYRVKEFKVNKNNQALNTRFWTMNDVIKCKQFMFSIQKRLKLKRIFRNLESFVGERIREGDYRLLRRTE